MLGMYILIALLTELYSHHSWIMPGSTSQEVTVQFSDLRGIEVGSEVVLRGERIGEVSQIHLAPQLGTEAPNSESNGYLVELTVQRRHLARLSEGSVALLTSPISKNRSEVNVIVEVLPAQENDADSSTAAKRTLVSLPGYSSYEEFWSGRTAL